VKNGNKPSAHTTLRDFGDLKRALGKASKEAAARAEQERIERLQREALQRTREAEGDVFKRAVGKVHGLPATGRADIARAKPQPIPASRQQDEQAVMQEALSDEFDVESLLETDASLSWRRPEIGIDVVRKLRRGVWALQGELDLHGMRSEEARTRLSSFMREAQTKGWRCLRVVHGKGLGSPGKQPVLKDKVHRWLIQSERVLAFVQARADEGGNGAVVVLLQTS
jgi:DNA-nicking Smr family endonuclease